MTTTEPLTDAAARRALLLCYADNVQRDLPDADHWGVNDAITRVRQIPTGVHIWNALASVLRDCVTALGPQWEAAKMQADQGSWMASKMSELFEARAPICDAHGPKAITDDTTIPASADGNRWHCTAAPGCTADFWRLDGSHITGRQA